MGGREPRTEEEMGREKGGSGLWLLGGDQLGSVEWMFLFSMEGTLYLTVVCICLSGA